MPVKSATKVSVYQDIDQRLAALTPNVLRISNHATKESAPDLDVWIGNTDNLTGESVVVVLEWCPKNCEGQVYWTYVGLLEGVGEASEDDRYFSCLFFHIGFENPNDGLLFRQSSPLRDSWEWYAKSRTAKSRTAKSAPDTIFVDFHARYPKNTDATKIRDIVEAEWKKKPDFINLIKDMYEEHWKYNTDYVLAKDVAGHTVGFALVVKSLVSQNIVEMAVIVVQKKLRGRGIGCSIMKTLLAAMAEQKKTLIIVTDKLGLYTKMGCGIAAPIGGGRSMFVVSGIKED